MLYTPVTGTNTSLISKFNYTDTNDSAYIDINITVPINEPPGNRRANITFTAIMTSTP